jgi:formate hydrogenlyase transcriptional activator
MDLLVKYSWPGNVRELQNVIERAVVLSSEALLKLGPDLLPAVDVDEEIDAAPDGNGHGPSRLVSLNESERLHIEAVLNETRGVIEGPSGAAKILDLHPNTLRSRMKKLASDRPRATRCRSARIPSLVRPRYFVAPRTASRPRSSLQVTR